MRIWESIAAKFTSGTSALEMEEAREGWSPWANGAASQSQKSGSPAKVTLAQPNAAPVRRSNAQVLVIDDESLVIKLCGSMFKQLGVKWKGMTSGREGVEWLRTAQSPCDLLLLDVMLADTTGFDVYRKVRSMRCDLPVVFISGFCSQEVLSETLEQDPLTSFLPKPFSLADMRLTLSAFSL